MFFKRLKVVFFALCLPGVVVDCSGVDRPLNISDDSGTKDFSGIFGESIEARSWRCDFFREIGLYATYFKAITDVYTSMVSIPPLKTDTILVRRPKINKGHTKKQHKKTGNKSTNKSKLIMHKQSVDDISTQLKSLKDFCTVVCSVQSRVCILLDALNRDGFNTSGPNYDEVVPHLLEAICCLCIYVESFSILQQFVKCIEKGNIVDRTTKFYCGYKLLSCINNQNVSCVNFLIDSVKEYYAGNIEVKALVDRYLKKNMSFDDLPTVDYKKILNCTKYGKLIEQQNAQSPDNRGSFMDGFLSVFGVPVKKRD